MNLLPAFVGAPAVNEVYHCDALTLLRAMPDASVDLIATDPPFNIDKAAWDSWATLADFLAWLDMHLVEFKRVLKPNGSLYLFAATKYQRQVENGVAEHFNILNNIRWRKPAYSTKAEMFDKDIMRAYFPASETIIFAERYGYPLTPLKNWFRQRVQLFELTLRNINMAIGSVEHGGGMASHYFGEYAEFQLPTPDMYGKMQVAFPEAFNRSYAELYREYEALRRPFFATPDTPYTDTWDFKTVNTYPGKHICEKPLDMCLHIIRISSRPDALVLDPFCGSGNMLRAAFVEGRQFIGGDMDLHWATRARNRITLPYEVPLFQLDNVQEQPA